MLSIIRKNTSNYPENHISLWACYLEILPYDYKYIMLSLLHIKHIKSDDKSETASNNWTFPWHGVLNTIGYHINPTIFYQNINTSESMVILGLSKEMLPIVNKAITLTHGGWDKMAAISQTTVSKAFSWMKTFKFEIKFLWSLFLRVQLTIIQHWLRQWLGAYQATSHYLN